MRVWKARLASRTGAATVTSPTRFYGHSSTKKQVVPSFYLTKTPFVTGIGDSIQHMKHPDNFFFWVLYRFSREILYKSIGALYRRFQKTHHQIEYKRISTEYGAEVFEGCFVAGYPQFFNTAAFCQSVDRILEKLKMGESGSLVRNKLLTAGALDAIRGKLQKLSKTQLSLLDIQREDYMLPLCLVESIIIRREGDEQYLDLLVSNVAFPRSKLIEEVDGAGEKCRLSPKYPFEVPPFVHVNVVFSRRIRPTLADDFIVSGFNIIAVCDRQRADFTELRKFR